MRTSLKPSLSLCNAISSSVQSGVRRLFATHLRCFSVSVSKHQKHGPHVGIVGSGPAGFYTAQQILKVGILNNYYCLFPFSDGLLFCNSSRFYDFQVLFLQGLETLLEFIQLPFLLRVDRVQGIKFILQSAKIQRKDSKIVSQLSAMAVLCASTEG